LTLIQLKSSLRDSKLFFGKDVQMLQIPVSAWILGVLVGIVAYGACKKAGANSSLAVCGGIFVGAIANSLTQIALKLLA
jgi:hypothetical protein